jgi:hypothetical protein
MLEFMNQREEMSDVLSLQPSFSDIPGDACALAALARSSAA